VPQPVDQLIVRKTEFNFLKPNLMVRPSGLARFVVG
jgi:hypothetical protein